MGSKSTEQFNWVKFKKRVLGKATRRGVVAIIVFTVLWEIGSALGLPIIGNVPRPSSVLAAMGQQRSARPTGSPGATASCVSSRASSPPRSWASPWGCSWA